MAVSLLLDPELVTLLYDIRIFPEKFNLRPSFWDEVQNAKPQQLINLLLRAAENTRSYLSGASINECNSFLVINDCVFRQRRRFSFIYICDRFFFDYCGSIFDRKYS